jgi:hypothetical protein
MIRKGEYHYGRRVLGANNKLKPLVGKSPGSAGVATASSNIPPINSSSMNSETLLKGSGYYNKFPLHKQEGAPRLPVAKPEEPMTKDEVIVIHV